MATLAKLFVELGLLDKGFGAGLDKAEKKAGRFGGAFKKAALGIAAGAGATGVATGAALLKIGSDVASMSHTIRIGTGATGDALTALEGDALAVFKSIPTSMDLAGTAIADLNTRTGQTGEALQDLARVELELARITGGDLQSQIASTTRLFGDWGIAADDQVATLDKLFRASQATGIGVNDLSDKMVKFGAPLRQMGFDFDTTAALVGKFEKEGVNTELVLGSLRIALGKMAKEGISDPRKAFALLVDEIKNAGDAGTATAKAIELFGARAGPDMAAAIREGRFEIGKLFDVVASGDETILEAAAATNDWRENLQILKNRITVALIPVATKLFAFLNTEGIPIAERLTARFERLTTWFVKLPKPVQLAAFALGAVLAAAGPLLLVLGSLAAAIGAISALFAEEAAAATVAGAATAEAEVEVGAGLLGVLGPIALVAAAVALFAVAYRKNWFHVRDVTNRAVGWIVKQFHHLVAILRGGKGLHDAIAGLPAPLQKVAILARRLVILFGDLIHGRWDRLRGDLEKIGRTFGNLLKSIGLKNFGQEFKRAFDLVVNLFSDMITLVGDLIHGRWGKLWGDFVAVVKAFVNLGIEVFRMNLALWKDVLGGLVTLFEAIPWGKIGGALYAGAAAAFTSLWNGMSGVWTGTIAPWLGGLLGDVAGHLGDWYSAALGWGASLVNGIWDSVTTLWANVLGFFGGLTDSIAGALGDWYHSAYGWGASLVNGIWDSVTRLWANVTGWLSNNMSPSAIAGYLGNWYSAALGWGASLVSGIASGITAGLSWVEDAIGSIEDKILGLWHFLHEPHSPSKLTMMWGTAITQGVASGVAAGLPDVVRQINRMNAAIGGTPASNGVATPSLAARGVTPAAATLAGGGGAARPVQLVVHNHFPDGVTDVDQLAELSARKTVAALRRLRAASA